jgi:hypothetical protein
MRKDPDAMRRRILLRTLILVTAALALLPACSKGSSATQPTTQPAPSARPSSTGKLAILSPTNGEVIHGTDVHLKVALTGARIVPVTTTHIVPDQGHLHVYLDNLIVGMNFKLTGDIPNVSPGMHVLRVEFVASDHGPFDPRVFTAVTFEVTR